MDPDAPAAVLGGLSPRAFLAERWGREPMRVTRAFDPVPWSESPEAFAGLALEPGVDGRLYVGSGDDLRYRPGPFDADDFTTLPDREWTLLVQDVERWFPGAASIVEPFRFLPNVRLDDLMVSVAADGGGVGAHADRYDVFLIQLEGRRRWRTEREPRPEGEAFGAGTLEAFSPVDDRVLEAGDLLYLPPRVAHEGTAVGRCVTASVGFRAPSLRKLLAALGAGTIPDDLNLWTPADEPFADDPGKIPDGWSTAIAGALPGSPSPRDVQRALGTVQTTPRGEAPAAPDEPLDADGLRRALRNGASLARTSVSRFAWAEVPDGIELYVGGTATRLDSAEREFARGLCDRGSIDVARLSLDRNANATRIAGWVDAGHLSLDPSRASPAD